MAIEHLVDFPHIVRDPQIHGGEPIVAGTRVPVRGLAVAQRFSPEMDYLRAAYPALSVALIEEALAFYDAHRAEINRVIRENEAALD